MIENIQNKKIKKKKIKERKNLLKKIKRMKKHYNYTQFIDKFRDFLKAQRAKMKQLQIA